MLYRYDTFVKSAMGPALAGAQVFVCTQPANTVTYPPSPLASIFSDPNGQFPVVQPLACDGFGHTQFYVQSGTYTVVVAIGNVIQNVYADQTIGQLGINVLITGSPVAGQALVATSSTTASWQTIAGTTLNYPAVPNQFLNSYTSATGMFTSAQPVLSGIANPTSNVNFIFNANTFTRTYSVAQQWNESLVNSSIASLFNGNFPTPAVAMIGSIWNGSTAVPDTWAFYSIIGIGANPTSIFAFEHGGSTGIASVQVPNLLVPGNATFSGIIYDNNGLPGTAGQVLSSTSSGVAWSAAGAGNVTTVANSDGSLNISPTSGAVIASLALSHGNTWTGLQTFTNVHITGTLADGTNSVGTSGQVLESNGTGVVWTTTTSTAFQSNGTPLSSQTTINFESGTGVTISNPSGGAVLVTNANPAASFVTAGYGGFLGAGMPLGYVYGSQYSGSTVSTTINQISVIEFYLQSSFTISKVSCYITFNVAGQSVSIGIYSSAGAKLIDSGALSAATNNVTVTNTLGTAVTLPPGVYYLAYSATNTSVQIGGFEVDALALTGMMNSTGSVKVGQAANATSASVMPNLLGTISVDTLGLNMPAVFFRC
jgi:hypothetical protein